MLVASRFNGPQESCTSTEAHHRTLSWCCVLYVERAWFRNLAIQILWFCLAVSGLKPEIIFSRGEERFLDLECPTLLMYQIHICSTVDPIKPINEPSQKRPLAEQQWSQLTGVLWPGKGRESERNDKNRLYQILFSTRGRTSDLVVVCRF